MNIYKTSKNTDRALEKTQREWEKAKDDFHKPILRISEEQQYQTIKGFGAAFTESGAYALEFLEPEKQKEVLDLLFNRETGNAYHFCRTHIASCDFSLENYDYVTKEDKELESFTLEHDKRKIIPLIKKAAEISGQDFQILASPWSPPGWMKTNGEKNNGGKLKKGFYKAWARHFALYIRDMRQEGVPIWGITVQNEPEATQTWDSCVFTAEEEKVFVRDYLGPVLKEMGMGEIKIYIHDHNRDRLFERSRVILDDGDAAKYISGAGIHWYCGGNYHNLEAFKDRYPQMDLIFTEGTQEEGNHHGSWKLGERYAENIINDLNRGVTGWMDWNLVLDLSGGPNHVYNLCSAPILIDRENNRYFLENSYYYIGHFSRFIRPGAVRVLTTSTSDDLSILGCRNPDGTFVSVILNKNDRDIPFLYMKGDQMIKENIPARSIMTLTH